MSTEERDARLAELGAELISILEYAGLAPIDIAMLGVAMAGSMLGTCPAGAVERIRTELLRNLDANEANARRMHAAYERSGLSLQEGRA